MTGDRGGGGGEGVEWRGGGVRGWLVCVWVLCQDERCVCVYERGRDTERRTVKETGRGVCVCMREGERRTVKETGRGVCVCV